MVLKPCCQHQLQNICWPAGSIHFSSSSSLSVVWQRRHHWTHGALISRAMESLVLCSWSPQLHYWYSCGRAAGESSPRVRQALVASPQCSSPKFWQRANLPWPWPRPGQQPGTSATRAGSFPLWPPPAGAALGVSSVSADLQVEHKTSPET